MLEYYAARFGVVEINATFYRMPTAKTLAGLGRVHAGGLRVRR